jgi:hypothetical protein
VVRHGETLNALSFVGILGFVMQDLPPGKWVKTNLSDYGCCLLQPEHEGVLLEYRTEICRK